MDGLDFRKVDFEKGSWSSKLLELKSMETKRVETETSMQTELEGHKNTQRTCIGKANRSRLCEIYWLCQCFFLVMLYVVVWPVIV